MATTKFVNRARMTTDTTGTGSSVHLVVAVPKYFTFSEAGLQDGDVVDYIIEDGDDFEIQHDQTYSSSGPSLSRGTPAASKVGGSAGTSQISLSGGAQVAIVGLAKSFDINTFTAKATPDTDDVLWGHSTADGARRAIPISGILGHVPAAGLVLLNSGTVSNAATLDIDLSAFAGYLGVRLIVSRFVPSVDDRELWLLVSEDGSSFDTSGYNWLAIWAHSGFASVFRDGANSDSKIVLNRSTTNGESVSNDAVRGGANAIIDIFGHSNPSTWPLVETQGWWVGAGATNIFTSRGSGTRANAQATGAVRVLFESGNIASGSWALYGYT